MTYLLVQNPGEAPIRGLTLFGETSKSSSDQTQIGMFGSGTKHAVLVCLRNNLWPVIYSGTDRLEYSVKTNEVFYSLNGREPRSCGCTVDYGKNDWQSSMGLAFREFVSNALDAVSGDPFAAGLVIESVTDRRAKSGFTRVYVPGFTAERAKEYRDFYFLHWLPGRNAYVEGPIRKVKPETRAIFYRRGVLLRTWNHDVKSLWDYNFTGVAPDESRQMDTWRLQSEATELLMKDPVKLASTVRAVSENSAWWEASMNSYTGSRVNEALSSEAKQNTAEALLAEFGNEMVLAPVGSAAAKAASEDGHRVLVLPQPVYDALQPLSLRTAEKVLTRDRRDGINVKAETRSEVLDLVGKWTKVIEEKDLRGGAEEPKVFSFRAHPNSEKAGMLGFTRSDKGVYFSEEIAGEQLEMTVVEELAHWYSGQVDFTRGFQEFLLRLLVR